MSLPHLDRWLGSVGRNQQRSSGSS